MFIVPTLLTVDEITIETHTAWQNSLMRLFYDEINEGGIYRLFLGNRPIENYCLGWTGIICEKGKVTLIRYYLFDYGNFNIYALPPSTQEIDISQCRQTFQFNTHGLPPRLTSLYLSMNGIYGTVDMTCLPITLEYLTLSHNLLSGYLDLTKLPPAIISIFLTHNRFQQNTVYYDHLPPTIEKIHLGISNKSCTNSIREVRALHPHKSKKVRQIFF